MLAARHGHADVARLLLDRGAKIDIADKVSYAVYMEQVVDGNYNED